MKVPVGISLSVMPIVLVIVLFSLESVASVFGVLVLFDVSEVLSVLFDATEVLSVLFALSSPPRRKNRLTVINRMTTPTALAAITNFFRLPELLWV